MSRFKAAAFYHKLVIVQLSANELPRKINRDAIAWDWPAAILMISAVLLASSRLVVTRATEHLILIPSLAIIGCIAGLALGRSRFPLWLSAIFGLLYGSFFIPWQMGLALTPGIEWTQRLHNLAGRMSLAFSQFFGGENVKDPALFLAAMAIIFWLISLNGGFRLARRGDPWGALIPFGLSVLIVQTYDFRATWKAWFLALFLLSFLLLLARLQYLKQNSRWEDQRIYVPGELSGNLTTLAFASAAILVLFAWATPALAASLNSAESFWSTITSPWRAVRDELGRALFSLKGEPFRVGNPFGKQFVLGRGIPQSPNVLFTVQITQADQSPLRYYWRDRVYDHYENGLWTSTYDNLEVWDDAQADPLVELEGRTSAHFAFTAQDNFSLLHSAGQTLTLDRPSEYSYAANRDGSRDIAALFANSPLLPGESYQVTASVAVPTGNQLQNAGEVYPEWITQRYLQLPENFSPQIRDLAASLTEGLSTPYDKAAAITNYLRGALEYVDEMPTAPGDRDPIEWALFGQKQGFCNYYASAEILMLRSVGIPARLAVGYSQGEWESIGGLIGKTIRQRDGHAWPEVYFPGIGWVEFEPTANQDPLVWPSNSVSTAEDLEHPIRPEEEISPQEVQQPKPSADDILAREEASYLLPSMLFLAALLTGVAALFWRRHRIHGGLPLAALAEQGLTRLNIQPPQMLARMAQLSRLPPLTRAYMEINQALGWLRQSPNPGASPEERAFALASLLPALNEEILTLSRDYQSGMYSRSKVSGWERALQTMKRIRWAARRKQVSSWIQGSAQHRE